MGKKSVKSLNRNDYVQKDIGWMELKKGLGSDHRYTDDKGIPYNVNLRVDCNNGWGYIDNDGKVWKVVWN